MNTFEEYLQDTHAEFYDGTDDDMPDKFDDWLCGLDVSEIMEYAESYGKLAYQKGRSDLVADIMPEVNMIGNCLKDSMGILKNENPLDEIFSDPLKQIDNLILKK